MKSKYSRTTLILFFLYLNMSWATVSALGRASSSEPVQIIASKGPSISELQSYSDAVSSMTGVAEDMIQKQLAKHLDIQDKLKDSVLDNSAMAENATANIQNLKDAINKTSEKNENLDSELNSLVPKLVSQKGIVDQLAQQLDKENSSLTQISNSINIKQLEKKNNQLLKDSMNEKLKNETEIQSQALKDYQATKEILDNVSKRNSMDKSSLQALHDEAQARLKTVEQYIQEKSSIPKSLPTVPPKASSIPPPSSFSFQVLVKEPKPNEPSISQSAKPTSVPSPIPLSNITHGIHPPLKKPMPHKKHHSPCIKIKKECILKPNENPPSPPKDQSHKENHHILDLLPAQSKSSSEAVSHEPSTCSSAVSSKSSNEYQQKQDPARSSEDFQLLSKLASIPKTLSKDDLQSALAKTKLFS